MPRPISTKKHKVHLNLSVTQETKEELFFLANLYQKSVSEMIASWASDEIATAKQAGLFHYYPFRK